MSTEGKEVGGGEKEAEEWYVSGEMAAFLAAPGSVVILCPGR